jgi:hypothetical protein
VSRPKREGPARRRAWIAGPSAPPSEASWLVLDDDDLLLRIERLAEGHGQDERVLEVVRSDRHFFIRQEAAKKLSDPHRLKAHAEDRHIGQILVRGLNRREDVEYLERLASESRHLEVRKAAEAQLRVLSERTQQR